MIQNADRSGRDRGRGRSVVTERQEWQAPESSELVGVEPTPLTEPSGDAATDYAVFGWLIALAPMSAAALASIMLSMFLRGPNAALGAGIIGGMVGLAVLAVLVVVDHRRWPALTRPGLAAWSLLLLPVGPVAYLFGRVKSRPAAWAAALVGVLWLLVVVWAVVMGAAQSVALSACVEMANQIVAEQQQDVIPVSSIEGIQVVDATPGAEQCRGIATLRETGATDSIVWWVDGDSFWWEVGG